ncbi:hypothetical protein [Pseudomonas sp. NPDC007930]|uniref:hypothetical protein n=1 Tax=Pseudomonas sp. NPDC007930 TaxID=3364417 RepID=UPI0036E17922
MQWMFKSDRVLLEEIAQGEGVISGGRVDTLMHLLANQCVTATRAEAADELCFVDVKVTARGLRVLAQHEPPLL